MTASPPHRRGDLPARDFRPEYVLPRPQAVGSALAGGDYRKRVGKTPWFQWSRLCAVSAVCQCCRNTSEARRILVSVWDVRFEWSSLVFVRRRITKVYAPGLGDLTLTARRRWLRRLHPAVCV